MPQRGIAYQPRVQTLGIFPEKQTRVLKERRIIANLGPRPRPSLCDVPSEHTDSLEFGFQGDALGWYALPRWGKLNDDISGIGHQRHLRYRAPITCPVPFPHRVTDTGPPPRFRFHALSFRMAPRWGLGRGQVSAIGG
jgi:hypothetical protein